MSTTRRLRNGFEWAKTNWRITLLVVLLVVGLFFLFAPLEGLQAGDADEETSGITNLQWGIDLGGGTSVRAPLVGYLADDLTFDREEIPAIEASIAEDLNVSQRDVTARMADDHGEIGSIELTDRSVTRAEFARALQEAGFDVEEGDIDRAVHDDTINRVQEVLSERIDRVGLTGASVDRATQPGGERFIIVEVPGMNRSEVVSVIQERGVVEIVAHYPVETDNGTEYREEVVLEQDDFDEIGQAQPADAQMRDRVPVRLTSDAAQPYAEQLIAMGFTREGVEACNWPDPDDRPEDPGYCLLTKVDGEVVYAAGITQGLADDIESSDFAQNPRFNMQTTDFEDAQQLWVNLNAGGLPTELALDRGTQFFLEPSLAEEFRFLSLVVGLFAGLAVAGMVYWRYRDRRVAAPMLLTASSEVVLLLAFSVAVGMSLDLPEVAGFIAVLGTGVDDLVIIADEIMQRGEIRTSRVFENRFRKAFWVIGVAAATTIIAMTPLFAMSLAELSGFAIVTIIGVLIGVTITRPAYGNILRVLLLD